MQAPAQTHHTPCIRNADITVFGSLAQIKEVHPMNKASNQTRYAADNRPVDPGNS